MLGSTHPASVLCIKHAELFSLSREHLVNIMQNYPQYLSQLGLTTDRLELLGRRPPVPRRDGMRRKAQDLWLLAYDLARCDLKLAETASVASDSGSCSSMGTTLLTCFATTGERLWQAV